ncbi:MAG: cysteine methyltransferase [Candidatus Levybacteria bacterium CG10_big_fil_rev_8_21_14_0_10_35_13]|nr:MAG: cysteine methyltransferase [Candidatus Levybacteria bacterium CG10_big_fil_rev_8_21_14_0_10_35_13]
MNTFLKIYHLVSSVPKGKVTTYSVLARFIGTDPRVIGFALHANKDTDNVPCHRVINSKGKISEGFAFGGPNVQKKMLENEGVKFDRQEIVNLEKFGFFLFKT